MQQEHEDGTLIEWSIELSFIIELVFDLRLKACTLLLALNTRYLRLSYDRDRVFVSNYFLRTNELWGSHVLLRFEDRELEKGAGNCNVTR